MGKRFNLSRVGRLLVVIISLTHAIDIAKMLSGTEVKKPNAVIEYELTKVPAKHKEITPADAMDVFMSTILNDKHGAMIYQMPKGAKLGQIKEAPQDRKDEQNKEAQDGAINKVEEQNRKVLGPADEPSPVDINEKKVAGEVVKKSKNSVVKFGNNEDSGFTGPEEPVQHIPEIDVSDRQMELDRQNRSRAAVNGSEHGVEQGAK
jgi:hypothetical protein